MSSGWVLISPLPVPYPCFVIGKNPYPNPVKAGKPCQFGFGSGGYPRVWALCLACTTLSYWVYEYFSCYLLIYLLLWPMWNYECYEYEGAVLGL